MHITTPLNELIISLAQLGWEFKGLKTKDGTFEATAKNPTTGQEIKRTGNSPEMAVHAVFQYAQRANSIRAFAAQPVKPTNSSEWQSQDDQKYTCSICAEEGIYESNWDKGSKCPTCDSYRPKERLFSFASIDNNDIAKELGWKFLRFSASGLPIYYWNYHIVLGHYNVKARMQRCMFGKCSHAAMPVCKTMFKDPGEPFYITPEMVMPLFPQDYQKEKDKKDKAKKPVMAVMRDPGDPYEIPDHVPEDIMKLPQKDLADYHAIGWRVLTVRPDEKNPNTVALYSPTYQVKWPFFGEGEGPNKRFLKADREPEPNANWGINIVREDSMQLLEDYKQSPWVLVKVTAKGKTVPYNATGYAGWRASSAAPLEILVPENVIWYGRWTSEEIARMLIKNYRVPARLENLNAEEYEVDEWSFHIGDIELSDGWKAEVTKSNASRSVAIILYDPEELKRVSIQAYKNTRGILRVDEIINEQKDRAVNENDQIEVSKVRELFGLLRQFLSVDYILWNKNAVQGRNSDYVYNIVDDSRLESHKIDAVAELIKEWAKIKQDPEPYTEIRPGSSAMDKYWAYADEIQLSEYFQQEPPEQPVDEFGLPMPFMVHRYYPPIKIDLTPGVWHQIYQVVIDIVIADNWNGWPLSEVDINEAAQALIGIPSFIVTHNTVDNRFGTKQDLMGFFERELEWGIQYARDLVGGTWRAQEETLFDTQDYGRGIGIPNPKVNRFFNLLSYYMNSDLGSTIQAPEWSQRPFLTKTKGWIEAKRQSDPDYMWIWYKSELRVEEWDHNRSHADMLDDLFDEYGRDFSNQVHEVEPDEVGAGVIYKYKDGSYKIEHEQMNDPEIRSYAEKAIEDWFKSFNKTVKKKKSSL